jgi:eukaryotic-like serine/threonine-protein kinase
LREAKAAGSLNHPNIVTVHDVGEASLLAWIAVEYCPGLSLAEWLARYRTPARPRLAAECVANLAGAVAYAHSCGIWHRDIKPSNVLLALTKSEANIAEASDSAIGIPVCSDVKGIQSKSDIGAIKDRGVEKLSNARIKLADFGLAKLLDENTQNTASGTLLGTPAYMAPEQIESSEHQVGPAPTFTDWVCYCMNC